MKTGADISHWQSGFDAVRYKASGEDFIFLKATEGTSFVDGTFVRRWQASRAATLPRGGYHFARPSGGATAQADHYVRTSEAAGWHDGDVFILDMEAAEGRSASALVDWSEQWIERVRSNLGGTGLFYSYIPFVRNEMGNPGRIPGGCLGWIARYRTDSPYAPLGSLQNPRPAGWPNPPSVWQCSNGQAGCVKSVASIGHCDYNQMTDAAFDTLFKGKAPQEVGLLALSDAEQEEVLRAARQINSTVGAGQTSFSGTVEAILKTSQTLVNEGRTQSGTLGNLIRDVPTAVGTYLAVHPLSANLSDAERQDLAEQIAALDNELDADAIVDALALRLQETNP